MIEESLNSSGLNPPDEIVIQDRFYRLGKILFSLTIFLGCLLVVSLLSNILGPILYVFTVAILILFIALMVIFTLGTVFVMPNSPMPKVLEVYKNVVNANNSVTKITQFCCGTTKWLALLGIASAILGITFLLKNKRNGWLKKVVSLSVLIVIFSIILIIQLVGGIQ